MSCLVSWDPSASATNAAEKICLWLPSLLIIYDTFYLTLQSEMIISIVGIINCDISRVLKMTLSFTVNSLYFQIKSKTYHSTVSICSILTIYINSQNIIN